MLYLAEVILTYLARVIQPVLLYLVCVVASKSPHACTDLLTQCGSNKRPTQSTLTYMTAVTKALT